jgi:hypothetical protein
LHKRRGGTGFWPARWSRAQNVEAHVVHLTCVEVSREHRCAPTAVRWKYSCTQVSSWHSPLDHSGFLTPAFPLRLGPPLPFTVAYAYRTPKTVNREINYYAKRRAILQIIPIFDTGMSDLVGLRVACIVCDINICFRSMFGSEFCSCIGPGELRLRVSARHVSLSGTIAILQPNAQPL